MKVKQQIINFYQILKELPDNEEYNVEGIRNRVSMKADNLLFTLDNKDLRITITYSQKKIWTGNIKH